jgi:cholesterol oxidase
MPGPVGPNPSLTIAALADRACDQILSARPARPAKARTPRQRRAAPSEGTNGKRLATSLAFTERMRGYVALDVTDPAEGAALGRHRGQRLTVDLTITAADVDGFVADREHLASAEGQVDCDLFGGRLRVERGWFNLFVPDGEDGRRMLYRLHFADGAGNPLTLLGQKVVHDDPGADVWRDTSTLYVRVLPGHVPLGGPDTEAGTVAAGIITIHLPDFLKQLTTFDVRGPHRARASEAFGRLFLGELFEVYGKSMRATAGAHR